MIVPDYAGFGRSDKPTDHGWCTYDRHVDLVTAVLDGLNLSNAAVVVQEWGGPIGLRWAVEHSADVAALAIFNTGLFTGQVSKGFLAWRDLAENCPDLPVGLILQGATTTNLPDDVVAAYGAPFPTVESKAGAAQFPLLVPIEEGAVTDQLSRWRKPTLVGFSDADPICPYPTRDRHSAISSHPPECNFGSKGQGTSFRRTAVSDSRPKCRSWSPADRPERWWRYRGGGRDTQDLTDPCGPDDRNEEVGPVTEDALLDVVSVDGRALVVAAESNWARPVPDCPDWDAADLVRHTGGVLSWMATIVDTGERASFRSLPPSPQDDADLSAWFLVNLDRTVGILRSTGPDQNVWTFSSLGDQRVSWWRRRLAVEMAIHRWDAEYAVAVQGAPAPSPLDDHVAAAGIEEFVTEFLPGLLAQPTADRPSGTLQLQLTDAADAWLDLDDHGKHVAADVDADTTVRGTASDVLLWLTNRHADAVNVTGDHGLLDAWTRLKR